MTYIGKINFINSRAADKNCVLYAQTWADEISFLLFYMYMYHERCALHAVTNISFFTHKDDIT